MPVPVAVLMGVFAIAMRMLFAAMAVCFFLLGRIVGIEIVRADIGRISRLVSDLVWSGAFLQGVL